MAQLVERSLPTPEIRSSNPVIDQILHVLSTVLKRQKLKKKSPGIAHFLRRELVKVYRSVSQLNLDRGGWRWRRGSATVASLILRSV